MKETGGASALGHENYESAQRSYAKWQEKNPQAAARYGFDDYVQYVQDQWAKNPPAAENDRAADLATLARQMARVDERRAASQFYRQGQMRSQGSDTGTTADNAASYRQDELRTMSPTNRPRRRPAIPAPPEGKRPEKRRTKRLAPSARYSKPRKPAKTQQRGLGRETGAGGDNPLRWGATPRRTNSQPDYLAALGAWRSRWERRRRASPNARVVTAIQSGPAGSTLAGRGTAASRTAPPTGGTATAIKALFKAVQAILRRMDAPQPQTRRRKGDTDKAGVAPLRTPRLARTGAAARGRYAALQPAQETSESDNAYVDATAYAPTSFDWLMNIWEANSGMEDSGGLDDSFDTQQNHYYPQP